MINDIMPGMLQLLVVYSNSDRLNLGITIYVTAVNLSDINFDNNKNNIIHKTIIQQFNDTV